jgi:hypothetical protein
MDCKPGKVGMKNLYNGLTKKRKEIMNLNPIYLSQKDFTEGTYLIDKPGYYVLKENIIFNPNPNNDYMPRPDQTKYSGLGFSLGFFAVIAIFANGVYLDLNDFTISASKEFVLQQRFFSIIELANSPFLTTEGPGNFATSTSFISAENVIIRNGTLGLSSHHGIHSNMASNVLLENLTIENFEFVGVALNGGNCILAHKINIQNNRQDIPVLATYSAARFVRMFAKRVLNIPSLNAGQKTELSKRSTALENEMNKTFQEIMNTGQTTSSLFRNETGLGDGNSYGFLIKNRGFAVNELVSPDPNVVKTNNVFLRKISVTNLKCRVDEVIALSQKGGLAVQNDSAGAVLQIDKIKNENGIYVGTVLSDLQLYLAELALALNIPLGKNNITADTIEWSKSGRPISELLEKGYFYKVGGDSMNHQNKAIFGYRFDAINNLVLEKCSFSKIKNMACLGNDLLGCKNHDASKRNGVYPGASSVGVNFSYCSDVLIHKFKGGKIFSKDGDSTGVNIMFGSENVKIDELDLYNIKAGTLHSGKWIGQNYWGKKVKYSDKLPNRRPKAIGVRYQNGSIVDMKDVEIHDLKSCDESVKILKY